jgi:hypothetical protein
MLYSYVTINFNSGGAMKKGQTTEEQILEQDPETTHNGATHMRFGWKFEPLPLDEAMGLARASRMDGAEYSMLREQFALLVEDNIASVRITPPPAVSYQKARHHCLKVAKDLAVAITVRRAPGGHIVCWKREAQCRSEEPKSREGNVCESWETQEHNGSHNARMTCMRR